MSDPNERDIEAVARALWNYRYPHVQWETLGESGKDSYRYEAIAAHTQRAGL